MDWLEGGFDLAQFRKRGISSPFSTLDEENLFNHVSFIILSAQLIIDIFN